MSAAPAARPRIIIECGLQHCQSAPAVTTLLVGFDSAWTPTNSGALAGVLHSDDGTFRDLGVSQIMNYREAEGLS
jgi:hypothetical protein